MALLAFVIDAYSLVVFAAVALSWLHPPEHHPLVRLTARLTEPVLTPIRRLLPAFGGMDLSPLLLLLALRLLRGFLLS